MTPTMLLKRYYFYVTRLHVVTACMGYTKFYLGQTIRAVKVWQIMKFLLMILAWDEMTKILPIWSTFIMYMYIKETERERECVCVCVHLCIHVCNYAYMYVIIIIIIIVLQLSELSGVPVEYISYAEVIIQTQY